MISRYIQVYDNVLKDVVFKKMQIIANKLKFEKRRIDNDIFVVKEHNLFNVILGHMLKTSYNRDIKLHLGFCRLSSQSLDTGLRIHSDMSMAGKYAAVYYIDIGKQKTGTKFYKHNRYGYALPEKIKSYEVNNVLKDSNNSNMWEEDITVIARPNRLVTYQSDLFHAKFPSTCNDKRIVWVGFYDIK